MTPQVQQIPIGRVFPNPDQPRKHFDEDKLDELAASIKVGGLHQPIKVTPRPHPDDGKPAWMIVMGERRWRAHRKINAATIDAIVDGVMDDLAVLIQAIVENGQRADVTPLEEADAYGRALGAGMTVESLATALGKQPFRIEERLTLLRLEPEYRHLMERGQLNASQGYEMSRLSPRMQGELFKHINAGECGTRTLLSSVAAVLRDADAQADMFAAGEALEPERPTAGERQLAKSLEKRLEQVAAVLRASVVENEVIALRKVDPNRARFAADTIAAMMVNLRQIEAALRSLKP